MYKLAPLLMVSYIKSIDAALEVFDATKTFKEPSDYASFYILNVTPVSPHENLVDETGVNEIDHTKQFTYKETSYLMIRVDFRGDNCSDNMALFKSSFLLEAQRELLKEAGFGFLGLSPVQPINSLRDSKAKYGLTTTLKLIGSILVTDESPIIDDIVIDVSNTL
ncbi:MAG: hypothetical protein COB61_005765 [Thiotrichales bacterium]|nr:hypothetical protein [Thiotrichales bacterium]